jgi:hypothetical protein
MRLKLPVLAAQAGGTGRPMLQSGPIPTLLERMARMELQYEFTRLLVSNFKACFRFYQPLAG